VGLEIRWRPGPFSAKAEYSRLTTERGGQSVENTDLPPLTAAGWYVSGTWALTGEDKADGLDHPRRPFLRGGFGALEAAVRVERLAFGTMTQSDAASLSPRAEHFAGNADRAFTVGLNWYLNRWIKLQVNILHETLLVPARGPLPAKSAFWSRTMRLQFSL
jgi:phosphate-selective porin OprO/OprP